MAMNLCLSCKRLLDNPDDLPASRNCGGDCLACIASCGDPDALTELHGTPAAPAKDQHPRQ